MPPGPGNDEDRMTNMALRIRLLLLVLITQLLFMSFGCQNSHLSDNTSSWDRLIRDLKRLPTVKTVEPWLLPDFISQGDPNGLTITTLYYEIHTNLRDPLILRQVPVFLESAFRSYCELVGSTPRPTKKLRIYFFQTRSQWEDFTRHWTGELASAYLKNPAGAYYYHKACVAYHLNRQSNFSILAHEGWHQFSDELFRYRLPAWLDESIATNFEAYQWHNGQVEFSPKYNGSRLYALALTLRQGQLISLSDLLVLDAGRVLSHTQYDPADRKVDPRIAAYYAQLYALARFLREANYGRHVLAFRLMLQDAQYGRWSLDDAARAEALQRDRNPTRLWNAQVGQRIFQTYISRDISRIEPAYQAFCRKIVSNIRFEKKL
jgi:hypothetical protein